MKRLLIFILLVGVMLVITSLHSAYGEIEYELEFEKDTRTNWENNEVIVGWDHIFVTIDGLREPHGCMVSNNSLPTLCTVIIIIQNERIIEQNETIIQLLTEIRDFNNPNPLPETGESPYEFMDECR